MTPDPRLATMRGDIAGSVWPPVFSSRTASLAALLHQFDASQWLDSTAIAERQRLQLSQISRHFTAHSSLFADRLAAAGLDPDSLAAPGGLLRLPPLTRQMVQATDPPIHIETVLPGHQPIRTVNTSGSTGEPVIVRRTAVNQLHWLALTLRYHLWAEPDFNGRLAAIRANMKSVGLDKDWGMPPNLFFETGPGLRIDIEADIGNQLDQLLAFQATSVVIYPSNLSALLDEADARGADLSSIRCWRTLGETLSPDLIERVALRGKASVFDCYSSEEMGYLAIMCPSGSGLYHVMSETVIVEVIDNDGRPCAPGASGKVLVTDLHNHVTPMLRYDIGDHAEVGEPCPCGRGLPTIRRILGRTRNMIVKPDGTRHWPLTGYKQFRAIAPIRQYQFLQHEIDRIEVRLVVERPLTGREEDALEEHLHWKLRHPFRLDFVYFEDRLPVGRNGKFEEFLSLL